MTSLRVSSDSFLLSTTDENAQLICPVAEGLAVTEIPAADAGDPTAAAKPTWIAVQLPSGQKGFLPRGNVVTGVSPQETDGVSPQEIDEDMFYTALRQEVLLPAARTDDHYLFAVAFAESGVKNVSASAASDAIGPFKYLPESWAELVAEYGAAAAITNADRSMWMKQVEIAAREAHGDANKVQQLLGRTAQANELYLMHALGVKGGRAVLALWKDHPEMPVQEALRQGDLSAEESAKLVQGHPQLVTGSLAQVVEAAANMLTPGFDKANELAVELDPPEMQAAAAPPAAGNALDATGARINVGDINYAKYRGGGDIDVWITEACKKADVPNNDAWVRGYKTLCQRESSYNPNAINKADRNAVGPPVQDGFPQHCSRGVAQCVPNTFAAYHVADTSAFIYDPVANIAASIKYVRDRYHVSRDGSNLAANVQQADSTRTRHWY